MHYQPVGVIASPTVADNQAEQNGEEKNEGEQAEEEKKAEAQKVADSAATSKQRDDDSSFEDITDEAIQYRN